MTKAEELFHEIAENLTDTTKSKMFGALCIKTPNGKSGVMFWQDYMVFKLDGEKQHETINLDGASMFTPMAGRPMNGWVQVPFQHSSKWQDLAVYSTELVRKLEKNPKKVSKKLK